MSLNILSFVSKKGLFVSRALPFVVFHGISFLAVAFFAISASLALAASPADSLMDLSRAYFAKRGGLEFSFRMDTRQAATGAEDSRGGTLLVDEKDNRFALRMGSIEFFSDGKNLWQFNVPQKQVLVKLLEDLENKFHPSELLFKYLACEPLALSGDLWQGKTVHVLKLNPARYKGQFTEMEVWLDPKTVAPVRLRTVDDLGSETWFTITRLQDAAPKPADFVFAAPPGVDVIDLR
jgi:outer membrane lipoprotein carrier protein